jgi:hypothetical protein
MLKGVGIVGSFCSIGDDFFFAIKIIREITEIKIYFSILIKLSTEFGYLWYYVCS